MQSYEELADSFLAECEQNAKKYHLSQAQLTNRLAPCYRLPWWPEAVVYFQEHDGGNIVRNGRKGSKENFVNDIFAKRVYQYFCTIKQCGVLQQFFTQHKHAKNLYDKVMEAFEGHHGTNHPDTNLDDQNVNPKNNTSIINKLALQECIRKICLGKSTTVTEEVKQAVRSCYEQSTGQVLDSTINPFDYAE